jgi:antitoxin MazE
LNNPHAFAIDARGCGNCVVTTKVAMRTSLRKLGNSSAVIIPKPLLRQLGAEAGDEIELTLSEGRIVLAPIAAHPRAGWAEASKALAASGEDKLVWPEFGNEGDEDLAG